MKDRMDCGHCHDALVWDDDIKKEVCSACRAEAASTSYLARAFSTQDLPEDSGIQSLQKQITTWRTMHMSDMTRGLDELMGVIKQIYERDLVEMENIRFFNHFQKYKDASAQISMGCKSEHEHCSICSEEASSTFEVPLPPPGQINANGDAFPNGIQVPLGTKVYHENKVVVKCVQAKYRACLLDDNLLKEVLRTGKYNGENDLHVYMDEFVCEKIEHNINITEISGLWGTVPGHSLTFPHGQSVLVFAVPTK